MDGSAGTRFLITSTPASPSVGVRECNDEGWSRSAPPLAILALVAREIRAWLEPSKERVAVLHCKGTSLEQRQSASLTE